MLVTRKSMATGITRSIELPITEDQISSWENGEPIQKAMPELSQSQREFFISGMTDEEWDAMWSEEN
jgi:hypothetical protein